MIFLLALFLSFGLVWAGECGAQKPTAAELVAAQVRFEQQYRCGSIRYSLDQHYRHGPAWPKNTRVASTKGIWKIFFGDSIELHHERVVMQASGYLSLAYAKLHEKSIADGTAAEWPKEQLNYFGRVDADQSRIWTHGVEDRDIKFGSRGTLTKCEGGLGPWSRFSGEIVFPYGYSYYHAGRGEVFSEILQANSFMVLSDQLDGDKCWRVDCASQFGFLQIWFSGDEQHLPLACKLQVRQDDVIQPRADGDRFVRDSHGYCCGTNGPLLSEVVLEYKNLKYQDLEGRPCCTGYQIEMRETFADGQSSQVDTQVEISDVDFSRPEIKGRQFDFELFSVSENSRFQAEDDPLVPYLVSGGKIYKVVDDKTMESMEGVRYAMPRKKNWWLWGLLAGCLVAGTFLYRKKFSK